MRIILLLLLSLLCVSCVTTSPVVVQRVPYVESEYAKYKLPGTATITGQAFMKNMGGDVKYAAGNEVALNPVTSISTQWYKAFYLGGQTLSETDSRYIAAIRFTTADGEGRFRFDNIPEGEYYITTNVTWYVGNSKEGGWISKRVTIEDGQAYDIILHR